MIARPVAAPPTADAATAGVDLFYSLVQSRSHAAARTAGERSRAPAIDGGPAGRPPIIGAVRRLWRQWVYEARDGGVFVRQRVALADFVGDTRRPATRSTVGHPGRHGWRGGALRHRVRCREVAGSVTDDARTDRHLAAASTARRGALTHPDGRWHQGGPATRPSTCFPEFAPPLVEIQTEAPGLSSSDVEALISVPLEAAMNGVPGLDVLRSKSVLGLSSVVLIFENGTERIPARQLVQERLARVAADVARRGTPAGHPVAALVTQPRDEDRHVLDVTLAGRTDDAGAVDGAAAADGGARRGERRDLGSARSSAAGARRSRSPACQWRDAAGRRHVDSRCDVGHGGRIHRRTQPADGRDSHLAREDRHGSGTDGAERRGRQAAGRVPGDTQRSAGSSTSRTWSKAFRRRLATASSTAVLACC